MHKQIEITIPRKITVDEPIADEIMILNVLGVVTTGSCQGPPPSALIQPSSVERARELGYSPVFEEHLGDSGQWEMILFSPDTSRIKTKGEK